MDSNYTSTTPDADAAGNSGQVCVLQAGFSPDDALWLQARIGTAMHVLHCEPTPKAVEAALTPQVKMVVVQFDIRQDLEAPERLAQWLRESKPDMPVLGMGYANTPKVPLAALRGGTHDFLDMGNVSDEQLKPFWVLSMRGSTQSSQASGGAVHKGKTLALIGARPGMGVSTLAVHLCAELAKNSMSPAGSTGSSKEREHGMGVGLLDLGFPLRDGLMYMGLQSSFHMVDAIQSMHRLDPALLEAALPRHRSGAVVLPWPAQTQAMREVDPRATTAMVQRLRTYFKWQVLDLGGLPSEELVQAVAQEADHVWVVCDQSIGSLVSVSELVKAMPTKANGKPLCDGVVVNRAQAGVGMSAEDIAKRLSMPLLRTLPTRDAALLEAFSRGLLLSEVDASDAYMGKVRELAKLLTSGVEPSVQPARASGRPWWHKLRIRLQGLRAAP